MFWAPYCPFALYCDFRNQLAPETEVARSTRIHSTPDSISQPTSAPKAPVDQADVGAGQAPANSAGSVLLVWAAPAAPEVTRPDPAPAKAPPPQLDIPRPNPFSAPTQQRPTADIRAREEKGKGQSDESGQVLREKGRKLWSQGQEEIFALLSDKQKARWRILLGKKIDLSKLGFVTFKAPEFQSSGKWINSSPMTLKQLKGKVVALHFYAFG